MKVKVKLLSHVQLFGDPWTVAHRAPPSMGFSRQEYWSGLPFPSPGESCWPRDRTQVSHIAGRCFNLCTTREAFKYKNPSTNIKDFKGGKEARLKEEGGGRGRGGWKGLPCRHLLPPADTQALWDFTLGLQRREDWNLALPEIRPDQNQNLSSLPRGGDQLPIPSSGWGSFDQISASRTGGLEEQGWIGRVKERKERGKGREVNKVSCSSPSRGTLNSCLRLEETRDQRVPVAAAGS